MTNVIKNVTTTETDTCSYSVMMKVVVKVIATIAPVDIELEPVTTIVDLIVYCTVSN